MIIKLILKCCSNEEKANQNNMKLYFLSVFFVFYLALVIPIYWDFRVRFSLIKIHYAGLAF